MTLGSKIKNSRKRLGISQDKLAEIMNVSRQAITKWESDSGIPDISNLQALSKLFGVSVDYLLSNQSLPQVTLNITLDKSKYKNKLTSYHEILKEYYDEPWEIYVLTISNKLSKLEGTLDILSGGNYGLIKNASDLSPYYLVIKDEIKLLINIKDWKLLVVELPSDINTNKFTYDNKVFRNSGLLKLTQDNTK